MTCKPVISVITVSYNAEKNILNTIYSVLAQTYSQIEYIIIDGGSTDKTLDIIKKYSHSYKIKYLSEKDNGIYNAMNKGIQISTGDYLIFLNAGDSFYKKTTLTKIVKFISENKADIYYGDFIELYKNRKQYHKANTKVLLGLLAGKMPTAHQSIIATRESLLKNKFNESFKVRSDYNWLLECKRKKLRFRYINHPICYYQMNGYSMRAEQLKKMRLETVQSIQKNYPLFLFGFQIFQYFYNILNS